MTPAEHLKLAEELERASMEWANCIAAMLERDGIKDTSLPLTLGLIILALRIWALTDKPPPVETILETVRMLYAREREAVADERASVS